MPLEHHPERRGVPHSMRHAISIAEQSATGGCRVLPGKTWGLVYPENGARRERAIRGLLDGTVEPQNVAQDLRPDALIFDVQDIDALGVDAVKARVRDATGKMHHYNYDRFAQFIATMKGKDVDSTMLEQLYDGIAGTRTRSALLQGLGQTGQKDMRTALQGEAVRSVAALDNFYGIQHVTEALKLRWLQSQGFGGNQAKQALSQLRPVEMALIDALSQHFEQFVNTGDQASYTSLVEAIEQNLPALEKISEQQSESMERLEEELQEFQEPPTQREAIEDLVLPPDEHDEREIPPEQRYESREGTSPATFEITPCGDSTEALTGYYASARLSHYDSERKLWSKKKELSPYTAALEGTDRQRIRGAMDTELRELSIPVGYAVDISSLQAQGSPPEFFRDQYGCFYYQSSGQGTFSVEFLSEQSPQSRPPIADDTTPMTHHQFSDEAEAMVSTLRGSDIQKAETIRQFLWKQHFYPGGGDLSAAAALQSKLMRQSTGESYLQNLDASEYLECKSCNTLFVALCRKAGIPSRYVEGHKIDGAFDGKAVINSSTGHGWGEVWDGAQWRRMDATPPTKPEDQKKKDKKQNQGNPTPSTEAKDGGIDAEPDMNDQVRDRVDQQMESVKNESQSAPNGDAVQQGEQMLEDAKQMMEKMRQRLREFQDKSKKSDGFEELENVRDEAKNDDLLPEDLQELERNIDAKEKQMHEEMQRKLEAMHKDGFIDDQKKQQLEERLDDKDAHALDQLWEEIEQQGSLHEEFETLREEVKPLVDEWYEYFHDRLPPHYDSEADPDVQSRSGAIDRRALRNPRKLIFGDVFNPRVDRPTMVPRFLASIWIDVSGSMKDDSKIEHAKKMLVFYCELFSRISEEFGYIRYSVQTLADGVTTIKSYDHKYDPPERYEYPDGTSTVKARLMTRVHAEGGTNMLEAVQMAAKDLEQEMEDFPDYAAAFYYIGDGEDTCGNSERVRELLTLEKREFGLARVMRSGILLGTEGHRQKLAQIFGDENTTVASTFEDLVRKSMLKFDQQIEQYVDQLQ